MILSVAKDKGSTKMSLWLETSSLKLNCLTTPANKTKSTTNMSDIPMKLQASSLIEKESTSSASEVNKNLLSSGTIMLKNSKINGSFLNWLLNPKSRIKLLMNKG